MLAHGKRNKEICAALGYTAARVSVLKSNTKIRDEVEKYKDKLFAVDAATRLKELSSNALNVMEAILTSPTIAEEDKESAAKWVLEKVTGKPAQQVDVTSSQNISIFLTELDKIKSRPALPQSQTIDITPKEGEEIVTPAPVDSFDDWLDKNT